MIRDRCPAYITWEQFQKNQRQLAENQARAETRGVPRGGAALLPGLLYCGRCGARMTVYYPDAARHPQYICCYRWRMYGEPICQGTSGRALDELVGRQVLAALQPAALEASLAAAANIEQEWQRLMQESGEEFETRATERAVRAGSAAAKSSKHISKRAARRGRQ